MAKVSVIVPIYNVEQYIEKCLISLINQTFSDIEIWLVNDGSTDSVDKIINNYLYDERIKYIIKENGGYGSVLEMSINKVTSEYFLICDPDDWLENNAIEILYKKAIEDDLDIVVGCKNLVFNDNDEMIYDDSKFDECLDIKERYIYHKNTIMPFYFLHPSPHSKLYKSNICKEIKFPKKVSFTDYLLYLLALNNSSKVCYLSEVLSYYLIDRPGNSMTCMKEKVFNDHLIVMNSVYDQNNNNEYIYSRLFHQFRNVLLMMNKNASIETKNKYEDLYYAFLNKLKKHKKSIIKYYPNLNVKNRIYFNVLLGNVGFMSKILYKRLLFGD